LNRDTTMGRFELSALQPRRLRGCLALASLALAAAGLAAPAALAADVKAAATRPAGGVIQDPHYGDTLFHFYQSKYFTSITSLMVSQHFERVPQHADEAEVLRGGLMLSYGLHREAGEIFARLIEQGAPPPVRDRAWYYLAKIRYQRGEPAEAEAALARIEGALPGELQEDRVLLQAHLLMARDDHAGAAAVLAALGEASEASRYARFNLAVARVRAGEGAAGRTLLERLGTAPAADEEQRSLRDKANLALGFAALREERAADASTALQRVRLNGLHANKALLGFGWTAAVRKQPREALVPWSELVQRDPSDPAVLEARIAIAHAHAEIGALGQALQGYEQALAAYEREAQALDDSITAIRSGRLLEALAQKNPGSEMGWFWQIRELPDLPHPAHLTQVLAEHEFQEAFKNYRDLLFLGRNLAHWADNLGTFGDMLANRRQAYAERLPQVRQRAQGLDLGSLAQRRDAAAAELERVQSQADAAALASPREREWLALVQQGKATLAATPESPAAAQARERLRLASGALTWQLATAFPDRVWEAKKSLRTIDQALAQARERDAALQRAQQDEPKRLEGFGGRITGLDQRIKVLIPRVAALTGEQQVAVQDIAVAALERQKERLALYAGQARYAMAQLYDHATVARKEDRARQD
jgi:hypothetical protein